MSSPADRNFQDINAVRDAVRAARNNTTAVPSSVEQQPVPEQHVQQQPAQQRPATTTSTRRTGPPPSPGLARTTFVVMFLASVICLILQYVPEVAFAPEVFDAAYSHLRVLAWVPGENGFLDVAMFLGLASAWVIATRRVTDDFVWIPVIVVGIALVSSSIVAMARDGLQAAGLGIALSVVLTLVSVQAGRRLAATQPNTDTPVVPRATVFAFIFTFLPALALGRALFGRQISDLVQAWDENMWTLWNISTLWLWAAGALVALVVGIALSFVPFSRSTMRVPKLAAAGLVIAVLAMFVGPAATQATNVEAARLSSESPVSRLSSYCSWWSQTSDTLDTLVFRGGTCSNLDAYSGSIKTHGTTLDYDLGSGARFGPTDGSVSVPSVVSASYGDVIAVAAYQHDGTPGVIGVEFSTGDLLWTHMCPAGTVQPGVRFAGSSGDDADSFRLTVPGEGEGIFLICDGMSQLYSPHP